MVSPDKSHQEVLKDIHARDVSMGDVTVEMNSFTGPQEVTVAGVFENPPNIAATWVKRGAVQSELHDRLTHNPVTEIVAVGGFGKSWLAAWVDAELAADFDKRLWVNFRREQWQEDYGFDRFARGILQEIGFPQKDPTVKENGLLRELTYRLNDPNRPVKTLVVMDNVESLRQATDWPWFEQFLQTWMTQGQGSRILVTTRPSGVTTRPLELGGLSLAEGAVFLQRVGLTGDRLAELIALADGHPLLLNLAAAWVRQTPGAKVDDSAVAFFSQLFEPYRRDATSLAEAKVELVFEQVFEALPKTWQDLLVRVSVYRLPFDLAMAHAMEETVTLEDLQGLVAQALLVEEDDRRFTLHALIAELVQDRVSGTVKKEAHEQAIAYYQANYQPWDGTIASSQEALEAFHHACELGQYGQANSILDRYVNSLNLAGYWRNLLPIYQNLTQHWQPNNDEEIQNFGWALSMLAGLHENLGDHRLAIDIHQRAKALFVSIQFRKGEGGSLCNLGHVHLSLGQYQKAIDLYFQALPIQREIGNRQFEANSLSGLGHAYNSLGQYQRAIELHQQALNIRRKIGDRLGEAGSLGNLGQAYDSLGQSSRAIELHQQALDIRRKIGDRRREATSLGSLGNAYDSLGQCQRAIELHQQALEISQEIGDRHSEANSLSGLGRAYNSLGQHQRAIELHQQALDVRRKIGNRHGEATSLSNLGNAYNSLGQCQRAIELHQQALGIRREIGDHRGEAYSLNVLGGAYSSVGQHSRAIELHQQSLVIRREIGDRYGEAASLNNLGYAYNLLGQYQQAIELHQQSLVIKREVGDRDGEANSLSGLGSAYNSLGQYSRTIELYSQSLNIRKEIGDRDNEGGILCNLGNAHFSLGHYQKAIDFYLQALPIQREVNNRQFEANSLSGLGSTYNSLGQYPQAVDYHQQSLSIRREIGDQGGEAASLTSLGNAYYSLGQYQRAIEYHQQSLNIKQEIGDRGGEANSHWNLNNAYQQRGRLKLAMEHRHQAYRIWHAMQLSLAATPLPNLTKNMIQSLEDDWAEQLIASEKMMAWLVLPMGYFVFMLRKMFSPLTGLQKRLKVHPLMFWFALGVALVLFVAWLRSG